MCLLMNNIANHNHTLLNTYEDKIEYRVGSLELYKDKLELIQQEIKEKTQIISKTKYRSKRWKNKRKLEVIIEILTKYNLL